jgi:hypothetical protein
VKESSIGAAEGLIHALLAELVAEITFISPNRVANIILESELPLEDKRELHEFLRKLYAEQAAAWRDIHSLG